MELCNFNDRPVGVKEGLHWTLALCAYIGRLRSVPTLDACAPCHIRFTIYLQKVRKNITELSATVAETCPIFGSSSDMFLAEPQHVKRNQSKRSTLLFKYALSYDVVVYFRLFIINLGTPRQCIEKVSAKTTLLLQNMRSRRSKCDILSYSGCQFTANELTAHGSWLAWPRAVAHGNVLKMKNSRLFI